MFGIFRRKPETPEPVDALDRVTDAIDELNAAMVDLRNNESYRHLRPWVRPGDWRTNTKPKVMLGYWCSDNSRFVTVYGED